MNLRKLLLIAFIFSGNQLFSMFDKESVLKGIKPSLQEGQEVAEFVKNLVGTAESITKKLCIVVGSIGKHTWLKGDHDIDLFIMFDASVERNVLEKDGLDFGKKITENLGGRHAIKYAEHPYVRTSLKRGSTMYDIDIVPCYKIKKGETIKSAVDRSPLHLEHVLESLKPEQRDEVRLLKQFCKALGVYGSDAKRLGFSGYICELIVLEHDTLEGALAAAAKWNIPHTIGKPIGKFGQPLVIADPTDRKRNAAANVSAENLIRFMHAARQFIAKPSADFFMPAKKELLTAAQIKALKARETKFAAVAMEKPDIIDDVLYPQMRRCLRRVGSMLRHNEFIALRQHEWAGNEMILFFELEIWSLPAVKRMQGPSVFSKKRSEEFLGNYKDAKTYIGHECWFAEKQRKFRDAPQLLKSLLRTGEKSLLEQGIPGSIAPLFRKARLLEHTEFWDYVKKNREFSAFLRSVYF